MPPLPRSTLVGYAILAALVLVLGGRWLVHRSGQAAAPAPAAGTVSGSSLRVTRSPQLPAVVDVTGAVRRPGVYRLAAGSRVRDALARAGGVTRAATAGAVNLAAKLADGQQIVVPRAVTAAACGAATASAPAGASPAAAGPVSLAGATLEQLDTLPGVGPATAQKILDWRTQHGGFGTVDDLGEVPGIGPKKLAALRPLVQP
jgi:competence protein ComEA